MDADERVTKDLENEIKEILSGLPKTVAFWIGRKNFFMGKEVRYSGWQNDRVIRLFRKDKARYEEKNVHAEILAEGLIGKLEHQLIHNTYKDLNHFLEKMQRYAKWSAKDYSEKTPKVGLYHLGVKPFSRFFKHYFLRLGFLDGKVGFVISVLMAWGVFLRYAELMGSRRLIKRIK